MLCGDSHTHLKYPLKKKQFFCTEKIRYRSKLLSLFPTYFHILAFLLNTLSNGIYTVLSSLLINASFPYSPSFCVMSYIEGH